MSFSLSRDNYAFDDPCRKTTATSTCSCDESSACDHKTKTSSHSDVDMSKPFFNPAGLNWFVTGLFVVGDLAGGGIVALPTAIIQAEFWTGLIVCIILIGVVTYTAYVLGLSWNILLSTWPEYRHHCRKPYPEIGGRAMGPTCKLLVSICIDVTQFGISVVYLLLASKNIQDMIIAFSGGNLSFCILVLIVAAGLLPLCFLKSPQDFWWAVVIAMMTTSAAVILIITGSIIDWEGCQPYSQLPKFEIKNLFLSMGTLLFSVGGHSAFPTIQHDMKQPREFTKSVFLAFTIMAFMYIPVCIMGYLVYGDSLRDSIIPSIQTVWIQQAINILITVHCILTLTIVFNPLMQEVEDLFHVPQKFGIKRVLVRTGIMVAVVFVAESVPTFGPLLDLVGGSTLTLTSVILPCLFYIYLNAYKKKEEITGKPGTEPASWRDVLMYNEKPTLIICIIIIIIGIIGGGCATFSAIVELTTTEFSVPCYVSVFQKRHNSSAAQTNCCGPFQNITNVNGTCSDPNLKFYI
uniref:Aa_trans domain-containing protein n=1 Tax=Caenorhabditis tropicalis TaxID=1561998 RepID=A0A1I7T4M3_9PELO